MREIEFRGKDAVTGEWVYGWVFGSEAKSIVILDTKYISKEGVEAYYTSAVYPETIGQYTGLKDKSGKEICEGDIVRLKLPYDKRFNTTGTIVFDEETVSLRLKIRESTEAYVLYKNVTDNMEIIGNIHDNPELLK